ncbi:MAG TPA: PAS domain S-box protein, partial [Desulfuromonadales bacterium]|nr:PAS domain S-box protein [Desulfuromonadales bacterium]
HDAESFVDGITAVMNGTLPEFIKEYSCHSPESKQWFCCKVNSFKTDNRKYAVISHENITWRKLAESELCKLSKAVEQSPIAIIITDSDGKIEYVNPKFSDYTGYSAEEAVSGYPSLLKSGITPDDVYRDLWTSISAGKSWSGEMYNKRKDGTLYWEHALIAPFMDEDGESTHYIAFKEDITEKKDLTDQLNHAQRVESIGQLAGGLAHDLNNILSVINGYATLLKINQRMDQTSCDQVNEILSASARAGELTRSMLAYSRKQIMNKKALDLNPLLATIGTFITRIIGENITLTTTIHAYPLMVNADAVQIEQVLLNLATNARDAMPTGGSFTVETSVVNVHESTISNQLQGKTGRYACITIADTGKGMNEVTLKRIYDPFYTTKGIGKGSGLGMSMVHGIVTQHDGLIDLTSSVGCGTTFRIYLPLITEDEAESTDVEPIHHFERGTETILFVEDDQNTLDVTVEFLTRAGYTVLVAMNGQEAVDTFSANRDQISVVISDVVMPVKSGKEACDEILEIAPDTPYLFVSGHAYDIIENQGELGRGAELIMKPILPFVLLSKIRELIG